MNIYYNPEKFGLELIGEAEDEPFYDFRKFVVWKNAAGTLYWGQDSGCSCPSPFEFQGVDDLKTGSVYDLIEAADAWAESHWDHESDEYQRRLLQVHDLKRKVVLGK